MPRPKEPSAATRRLLDDLAARGVIVSARAVEDWAARGLAPAPIRRSLGRGRGMASEYPLGAVDQYAAVASVMRRGRPWQISVIKLLARGRLPANENLVRQALGELLAPPGAPARVGEDALGYAERVAAEAAAPSARPFLRAYQRSSSLNRAPRCARSSRVCWPPSPSCAPASRSTKPSPRCWPRMASPSKRSPMLSVPLCPLR